MDDDAKLQVRTELLMAILRGKSREREIVTVPSTHCSASPVPELLEEEAIELCVDRNHDHDQGWLPIRIIKRKTPNPNASQRRPCVIFLHPTGSSMDSLKARQENYALAGYIAVAIDSRYHGQRKAVLPSGASQSSREYYEEALVRAWKADEGREHPFLLDTSYDITCLLDYLVTRQDIDSRRIGITGYSLGGMHAWLAAVADERIGAVAICSGVQGWQWAVDHKRFKGRVESIPQVFQAAAKDLGKAVVDAEVVERVWNKLVPGLLKEYDTPRSLPTISPRPLLVTTGELDDRCPLAGVKLACENTKEVYEAEDAGEKFEMMVEEGIGHRETVAIMNRVRDFFDHHFRPISTEV